MRGSRGYSRAREALRHDFEYRCGYCMIHEQQVDDEDGFCIDHFRPRSRGGKVNDYANLYWVCIACNRFKGDAWPTRAEQQRGRRFADPCAEQDYGHHFVEDDAGELVPRTACGEYHVARLRLNRPARVRRRRERNERQALWTEVADRLQRLAPRATTPAAREAIDRTRQLLDRLRDQLAIAIPRLPALEV
jgi:hypothetical protein